MVPLSLPGRHLVNFAVCTALMTLGLAFTACFIDNFEGDHDDDPVNGPNNPPALTGTVTINNTNPKVGDTLTASYQGNGSGTATWQWLANNITIYSETVKIKVSPSNYAGGTFEVMYSRP